MKIKIYPTKRYASLILFSAILLMSCDKDKDTEDKDGSNSPTKTVVYAAGLGNSGDNLVGARYWKDGEIFPLTDNANEVMIEGIFASNGDVYVVGSERSTSGSFVSKYWKNGVATELTDGSRSAFGEAIFVDKGDVYVSGVEFEPVLSTTVSQAKYWKNGVVHELSEKKAQRSAGTSSIAMDGNDLYIAGSERNGSFDVAKYWKNGEPVELSAGTSLAAATGIAVVNGNVHVSGHEFIDGIAVPTYWLNGVPTRLSDPGVGYWTNGMAVSGGNVYILVRENGGSVQDPDKIGYWKVGQSITQLTNGVYNGSVYGIAADGNDVYVVGDYRFDGEPRSACIWKNGEISKLHSGGSKYSEATGVFLAKEPI